VAFSAIDGPADFDAGIVARVAYEGCGLDVKLPAACSLEFDSLAPVPQSVRLSGDLLQLTTSRGPVRAALLDTHHLLIEGHCRASNVTDGLALLRRHNRLLVAAAAQARPDLLDADMDAAIAARAKWLSSLRLPPLEAPDRRLLLKCLSVLKTQLYSPQGRFSRRWTTPDRWPHRRLFLWDSVFHAVGWRHVDASVARDAVAAVLETQRSDGFVPHCSDPRHSTRITQPPVLAIGAAAVDALAPDDAFVRHVYEPISRMLEFVLRNRDTDGGGLLEWAITDDERCRCDESGMDNSPRFDQAIPLDAPDFNAFVAHEAEVLHGFAMRLGLPGDARKWQALHRRLCELINARLWNEELGLYVDCEAASGRQSNILAASGFLPLLCGAPDARQVRRLAEHIERGETFGSPLPVPTTSPGQSAYSKDMWRGPVWVNINWLIADGFARCGLRGHAELIRRRTLEEVSRWYERLGCLFEYYDDECAAAPPELLRKGRRLRDNPPHMVLPDYGWTAALCADWLLNSGQSPI
jgi:glycogen debranching enzyme